MLETMDLEQLGTAMLLLLLGASVPLSTIFMRARTIHRDKNAELKEEILANAQIQQRVQVLENWREEHKKQCSKEHGEIHLGIKAAVSQIMEKIDSKDAQSREQRRLMYGRLDKINSRLSHMEGQVSRFTNGRKDK